MAVAHREAEKKDPALDDDGPSPSTVAYLKRERWLACLKEMENYQSFCELRSNPPNGFRSMSPPTTPKNWKGQTKHSWEKQTGKFRWQMRLWLGYGHDQPDKENQPTSLTSARTKKNTHEGQVSRSSH